MAASTRRGDSAFHKVGKRVTASTDRSNKASPSGRGGLVKGGHPHTTRTVTRGGEKV